MIYAIGKPGGPVRQFVEAILADMPHQILAGELAVPVDEASPAGMIAADGGTVVKRTQVDLVPVVTAVQLATTIAMPAGGEWAAGSKSYVGSQKIAFASAGIVSIKMRGAWVGETTATVLSAADYQAWLIDRVKSEGERRSMLVMSSGGAKKTKYAAKAVEIENWFTLGGIGALTATLLAAFAALNTTVRKRKFRYAMADARLHGDTVDKAIARFVAGADASQDETARLEAIEQAGVDAIRAATSSAAKLAAFDAINWAA